VLTTPLASCSRVLTALFAALALGLAAAPTLAGEPDRLDAFVEAERAKQRIPGVGIAIVRGGEVVKAQGYGLANVEHQVPVKPETIFQSGSVGKQFTAVAVMLQLEDGKLALEDPLTRFFPDAPAAWARITVRHLLTHTSGIADYGRSTVDYRKDYSEEEFARVAFGLNLEFPPGSRHRYSNTGYALLGFIVGQVTPVTLTDGTSQPYGFGWRLGDVAGQKVQRHGGSWQGFKAEIARFLGSDLTIVVLANLAQAEPERFTDGLAALVTGVRRAPAGAAPESSAGRGRGRSHAAR